MLIECQKVQKAFAIISALGILFCSQAFALDDVAAVARGNTAFALDLYGRLKDAGKNTFLSPYSISTALAMAYAGARENTEKQMAEVLHFDLGQERLHPAFGALQARIASFDEKEGVRLDIANGLWPGIDYPFLPAYLVLLKEHYGVSVRALDYRKDAEGARKTINAWAEGKTQGKIKEIIPQGVLNALTRLVLANAIYFKGKWASPFDPKQTKAAPFQLSPDKSVKVPMMTQEARFDYAEFPDLQVLEIPYGRGDLSMAVLLPKQVDGLRLIEEKLNGENLATWLGGLRETSVRVFLPRFRMTSVFSLGETLKAMGMVDAFGPGADFSGMDGTHQLSMSAVLHKAFVEVNEEGTEAAAVTAIPFVGALPKPPPVFRADHPFVFLIQDKATGTILFIGRVADPSA